MKQMLTFVIDDEEMWNVTVFRGGTRLGQASRHTSAYEALKAAVDDITDSNGIIEKEKPW